MRDNNRKNNEMREVKVTKNYIMHPEGSVLIEFGNTKVICNATIEEKVPPFLKGKGTGWVTAEYSMLPRSTNTRNQREASKGKVTGRTMEIQRLIGRLILKVLENVNDDKAIAEVKIEVVELMKKFPLYKG